MGEEEKRKWASNEKIKKERKKRKKERKKERKKDKTERKWNMAAGNNRKIE